MALKNETPLEATVCRRFDELRRDRESLADEGRGRPLLAVTGEKVLTAKKLTQDNERIRRDCTLQIGSRSVHEMLEDDRFALGTAHSNAWLEDSGRTAQRHDSAI
ncbi:hypothetical protein EVAR_70063_1 [Eumeta japonica]|uniref:Uncharacterized protein n=1 Tax=Eumeta variegata TaxID=151549 RepID=A0A4C2ACV6_EUMVA|nr:hypothetical protein EVAR_70063_1 [Eumeta japonica]